MKKYSKSLGSLLTHKKSFFESNDEKLAQIRDVSAVYTDQPLRTCCKNCCRGLTGNEQSFGKGKVHYWVCATCGHVNGANEDTDTFCRFLYTDQAGRSYAQNYSENSEALYAARMAEVYLPKAQFLWEALQNDGADPQTLRLVDIGAGAGYFVGAAGQCGFESVRGFEPSESLVALGTRFLEGASLVQMDLEDTAELLGQTDGEVISLVGVLEHLQNPREALGAISANPAVRYLFVSLPLMSPTVAMEAVFEDVMPRHLSAGHTHLYTETSIRHLSAEFGFRWASEWWFGLDAADLFRSVLVSLHAKQPETGYLETYWQETMRPVLDDIQSVLDRRQVCSEIHLLLAKTNVGRMTE